MKTIDKTPRILKILADIEKRMDSIEELQLWLIKAESRFKKGQRVQLSEIADRANLKLRRGVRKGTIVVAPQGFSIKVLPDGYSTPHSFFHGFWKRIGAKRVTDR